MATGVINCYNKGTLLHRWRREATESVTDASYFSYECLVLVRNMNRKGLCLQKKIE